MKALILILISMTLQTNSEMIWNISNNNLKWRIINDGVMGGLSTSEIELKEDYAEFSGHVSLENNGGFAMTQLSCNVANVEKFSKVELVLQGDGKAYQFRLKHENASYYSYVQRFDTSGQKETIILELKDFYPAFRGRTLNKSNFKHNRIEQVAILIGNKKEEDFNLKLFSVQLKP